MLIEPVALLPPPRRSADAYAHRAIAAADATITQTDARSRPETATHLKQARRQPELADLDGAGLAGRRPAHDPGSRFGTLGLSWDVLKTLHAFADQRGLHIDRHGMATEAYNRVAAQSRSLLQVDDLSV